MVMMVRMIPCGYFLLREEARLIARRETVSIFASAEMAAGILDVNESQNMAWGYRSILYINIYCRRNENVTNSRSAMYIHLFYCY